MGADGGQRQDRPAETPAGAVTEPARQVRRFMSASEKLEHAVPRTVDVHSHPTAGFVGIVGLERF